MKTQPVSSHGLAAVLLALVATSAVDAQTPSPIPGYAYGGYPSPAPMAAQPVPRYAPVQYSRAGSVPSSVMQAPAPMSAPVAPLAPVVTAEGAPGLPVTDGYTGAGGYTGGGGYPDEGCASYGGGGCDAYGCSTCGDGGLGRGLLGGGMLGGGAGGGLGGMALPGAPFGGYDSMQMGQKHGPLGDGGCCAPRWFDVHAEWMYLQREDVGRSQAFASDGISGPIVLGTDDLSLQEQSGFRVTAAYLVGPATNLEATYFGTFNWASSAEVTDPNSNLYSVVSNFGVLPANGFAETDQAFLQRLSYSTQLDNGELNLRRRWISANCLWHSSFLGGVRYVRIREDFRYFTQSNLGFLDYLTATNNDMVGFQLGFDTAVCLTPRFKLACEVEGGIYGNHASQETDRQATSLTPPLKESLDKTSAAFVGEAGLMGLFRITPRTTIRAGYTVLYVSGVALATDNFNAATVFTPRVPVLNADSDALYHGANLGLEFTF